MAEYVPADGARGSVESAALMRNPVALPNWRPAVLAGIILTIAAHALILWLSRANIARGSYDFVSFYSAGQIVARGGDGHNLYDIGTQHIFQKQFLPRVERPLLYFHPPFEVLAYLPFVALPFPWAFSLWTLANLVMLAAIPILLFPDISELRQKLGTTVVTLLPFSFFPVLFVLLQGQDAILFLLLWTWAFALLRRGKEFPAGVFLAFDMFRFQLMPLALLVFVIHKRLRLLAGFITGCIGLFVISLLITGWNGLMQYLRLLQVIGEAGQTAHNKELYYINPGTMPNLRGLAEAAGSNRVPQPWLTIAIAVASLLLIVWALQKGADDQTVDPLEWSLYTIVALLVGYHTHLHDLTLLLWPLLLVANHLARRRQRNAGASNGMLLLIIVLFLSPTYLLLVYVWKLELLAIPVALFAWLIAREISRQQHPLTSA